MASHGTPRPAPAAARSEAARAAELQKIQEYRSLVNTVNDAIDESAWTHETLELTSRLLTKNPEYYTIWNQRRRILLHLVQPNEDSVQQLIRSDLEFIFPLLTQFPKCYWIWNHRAWLLRQASHHLSPPNALRIWREELELVNKMHIRDSRNFHGWDYRRTVVAEIEKLQDEETKADGREERNGKAATAEDRAKDLIESEYEYTTKMVRAKWSNFSAWHYRSVVLPRLLGLRQASPEDRRRMFDAELSFLKNALMLDPYDQSLWYYHEYLMSLILSSGGNEKGQPDSHAPAKHWVSFSNHDREEYLKLELEEIKELLEDPNVHDCKWVYFHLLLYVHEYLEIEAGNRLITTQEMTAYFTNLKRLDPLRSRRWQDWEQKMIHEK